MEKYRPDDMRNRIIIIGAGGHGKVVADNALKNGYTRIAFVDDRVTGMCMGFPVLGTTALLDSLNDGQTDFIIALGDNATRRDIALHHPLPYATLVHPSAQIGSSVAIGEGTVVMANGVVNACARIGRHCIINTGAIVEHDDLLEDFVHLAPRVALGGTVRVGQMTHVGIGATVKNNISIGKNCLIGAGAVVVKDLHRAQTYVGLPARGVE